MRRFGRLAISLGLFQFPFLLLGDLCSAQDIPPSFVARMDFIAGASSQELVFGDFNNDGRLDLAIADPSGNSVSVMLGNGDGSLQPVVSYLAGSTPSHLASADFNADGKMDLVVANGGAQTLSVLLGNGDGTFQPQIVTTLTSGTLPSYIVSGDFNGDGKADIAVQVSTSQFGLYAVAVLLANGDGTFQPEVDYTHTGGPGALAVADLNQDGKLDLLSTGSTTTVDALLGNGDGTFRTVESAGSVVFGQFVVADFNQDGKDDFASSNSLFLGNGDGTFQAHVSLNPSDSHSLALTTADFNGDQIPDLVMTSSTGGGLIMLGNGDGTFQQSAAFALLPPAFAVVADFNADGKVDLAVTANYTQGSGIVGIALGKGDGTLNVDTQLALPTAPRTSSVTPILVGDFNGDGNSDVIVGMNSDYVGSQFDVVFGNGDGTFQAAVVNSGSPTGYTAVADFNQDGKDDFALAAFFSGGGISISLSNGDGTFNPTGSFGVGLQQPGSLAVADFNGDGKLDIATGDIAGDAVGTVLGNGDGTFGLPVVTPLETGHSPLAVTTADLNNDGTPDAALIYSTGNPPATWGVSTLIGNGDGSFQAPVSYSNGISRLSVLAAGDFNHDGNPDLAVLDPGSAALLIFIGQGDGTLATPSTITLSFSVGDALSVTDLNGDGQPDIVLETGTDVLIFPGNGDGTFQPPVLFGGPGFPMAIADFNGDSSPDIVNALYPGIDLLFNRPAGPALSVSPHSVVFGNQAVGTTSAAQSIVLNVTGRSSVTITSISIAGTNNSDFTQTDSCSSIAAGSTCTVNVVFKPGATGARAATLTIFDNAPGSPHQVSLAGTGVASLGLAVSGSSSAIVSAGQPATYALSIGGAGVSGTATLTCTGAPTGAACSLPSTLNVSATAASNFTVTVSTTARTMSAFGHHALRGFGWSWAVMLFGTVLLSRRRNNKSARLRVSALLLFASLLLLCGCGSSSSSSGGSESNSKGTPVGTYTLTVTATSGTTTQSVPLTLMVQ